MSGFLDPDVFWWLVAGLACCLLSGVVNYLFTKSSVKKEQEDINKLFGLVNYRAGAQWCAVTGGSETPRLAALQVLHYGRGVADAAAIILGDEAASKLSKLVEEIAAEIIKNKE